ncbi:MAG: ParB N-terminal domain-containing protein [Candidatus Gracilibacteria bacterium]
MEHVHQNSPLLETPPQERILSKDSLKAENLGQCTRGGRVLKNDYAQLIRREDLENEQIFYVPIGWCVPNPDQPREDFEFDDQKKFDHDLFTDGQRDAAKVTPILINGEAHLKFILVDGERRWRSMTRQGAEYIKIKVEWHATKEDIFEAAFDSTNRKNLNPIEEAKSYKKMIARRMAENGITEGKAMEMLSREKGISVTHIKGYLKLLTLNEERQGLVVKGRMTVSAAMEMVDLLEGEDDIVGGAFFRNVTKAISALPHSRDGKRGKIGRDELRDAMAGALETTGRPEDALRLKAEGKCNALVNALGQLAARFESITGIDNDKDDDSAKAQTNRARKELLFAEMIKVLHDRQGQQAGEVMDTIEKLMEAMQEFHLKVLKVAMQPDPLEIPEGAPTFTEAVKELNKLTPINRFVMTKLAEASDGNTQYTGEELFEITRKEFPECPEAQDAFFFKGYLDSMLPKMISNTKLRIDVNRKRVKDSTKEGKRTKYVNAYRLAWITEKQ